MKDKVKVSETDGQEPVLAHHHVGRTRAEDKRAISSIQPDFILFLWDTTAAIARIFRATRHCVCAHRFGANSKFVSKLQPIRAGGCDYRKKLKPRQSQTSYKK